jgi:hypothetical protein
MMCCESVSVCVFSGKNEKRGGRIMPVCSISWRFEMFLGSRINCAIKWVALWSGFISPHPLFFRVTTLKI